MKKMMSLLLVLTLLISAVTIALAEDKPYAGQKLTLLFMSGSYCNAAKAIEKDFEATTGAEIEIVDFPYASLHEKMLLDLTSGTSSYDAISIACQWDGEMAPFLEPLDSYIERDGFDIDAYDQNILDNCGRWDGVIYGIPHANTPYCLAYRTDIVPEEEVPTTWEDYIAVARKYMNVDEGLYGIACTAAKSQYGAGFYTRIWQNGQDWADEDWNVTMNNDVVRWTLESIADELTVADPACLNWGVADATAAFQNGNAVFLETWPTLGICLTGDDPEQSAIAGNWGLMPMPTGDTGITLLSGWDIGINGCSENKELAWEFIKAYTSAEAQLAAFTDFSILPTRLSVWEEDAVKNSNMYDAKDYLSGAVIWWRIPVSEEARAEINNSLHAFMSNDIDADEAMELMQSGIENALANDPPPEGMKNATYQLVQSKVK